MARYSTVDVKRGYRAEFFEPIWIRAWTRPSEDMGQFRRIVREARSCSGFGVSDPYQIQFSKDTVTTLTGGGGLTLQEHLRSPEFRSDEEWVRKLGDELCLGLLRLHDGLGERHGALCPFNVRVSEEACSIWSVPTARLEMTPDAPVPAAPQQTEPNWLRQAARMAKKVSTGKVYAGKSRTSLPRTPKIDREQDYHAPEEPNGSFLSDVYSIGAILYRVVTGEFPLPRTHPNPSEFEGLLFENVSQELSDIIYKSLQSDPLDRFLGIKKLALALNSRSKAAELDVSGGKSLVREGLQDFRESRIERALECFSEAGRRDSLSTAVWNNIAAVKMRQGKWLEAVYDLEKAYKLSATHPIISSNIGHCFLHLDDDIAVQHWAEQALAMNPWLARPSVCLVELSLKAGKPAAASSYAMQAVVRNPGSRLARLSMAAASEAQNLDQKATEDRQHAALLAEEPPLWDALIDEDKDPPWGPIREENSDPGSSGSDSAPLSTSTPMSRKTGNPEWIFALRKPISTLCPSWKTGGSCLLLRRSASA